MAYCLVDGKVDQESVFETNLYNELLEQLKRMTAGLRNLKLIWNSNFIKDHFFHRNFTRKPIQNIPKRSKTLIWLYLQIIGTPVERLLAEERLWTFDRDDFEKAFLCLTFKNAARNPSALEMRELISKHFSTESELAKWSNDMYEKVTQKILYLVLIKTRPLRYALITFFGLMHFLKEILLSEPWNEYLSLSMKFRNDVYTLLLLKVSTIEFLSTICWESTSSSQGVEMLMPMKESFINEITVIQRIIWNTRTAFGCYAKNSQRTVEIITICSAFLRKVRTVIMTYFRALFWRLPSLIL